MTAKERFDNKFSSEPNTGCWLWTAYIDEEGYGRFWLDGDWRHAHNVSIEFENGVRIKRPLVVDHLCRERSCVNPRHLRVMTDRENIMAPGSMAVAKLNREKTHCPSGHEYNDENVYRWRTARYCRQCCRDRERRRQKETN